jgi:hypothetical protein
MMLVGFPVTGPNVYFNVPTGKAIKANNCITKVRTRIIITPPRVDYLQQPPVFSNELSPVQ